MAKRLKPTERDSLLKRVEELELRVKLLEARVRATLSHDRRAADSAARLRVEPRRSRPKSRCPGCLQELPPGRRGDHCVWCGFSFDAVQPFKLPGA